MMRATVEQMAPFSVHPPPVSFPVTHTHTPWLWKLVGGLATSAGGGTAGDVVDSGGATGIGGSNVAARMDLLISCLYSVADGTVGVVDDNVARKCRQCLRSYAWAPEAVVPQTVAPRTARLMALLASWSPA